MNKKNRSIILVALLAISMVPFGLFIIAGRATTSEGIPDYYPVDWRSGLAGDLRMPEINSDIEPELAQRNAGAGLQTASTPEVGTTVWDWYLYAISAAYYGEYYPYMTLRACYGNVEVWVAQDEMLQFLPGDPRNDNPLDWQVTDEMANYIAEQFNNVIYPVDTGTFGAPFNRDGTATAFQGGYPDYCWDWIETDNSQRVILKIFNIVDDGFFDPTYPYYVVGFFSPTYTNYYNRNMIHIDNWRYWQRLGDEGFQWFPDTNPELEVTRPYVYESTVAHEYQHNIHNDRQPNGPLWMNEGCSMLAEPLCGYDYPYDYLPYFLATPDNALTEWGDQGDDNILADYGQVLLWTTYIHDRFGVGVLSDYVQSGIPGIAGINAALAANGYKVTMDDIFHDWRIANLIHTDFPGWGKYNYDMIDLGAFLESEEFVDPIPRIYEIHGRKVPWTYGSDFGGTKIYDWYETDIVNVGPYGTDYILLDNLKGFNFLKFKGDSEAIFPHWVMVDGMWYSGQGDLMNTLISTEVEVDAADPWLYLTTYWDIEDNWDFGFVQISTDGGATWTSLANDYTTDIIDPSGHDAIRAYLPGLTSWSGFITPDGIIPMAFDLTDYAGQTVQVGFRYMTDWSFTYEGWYLLGASVGSDDILGDLELQDHIPQVNWMVTVIQKQTYKFRHREYTTYWVHDMRLCDWCDQGLDLFYVGHKADIYLVISPIMEKGLANYGFTTYPFKFRGHCRF